MAELFSSIGIIGGADGPPAIFITGPADGWKYAVGAAVAVAAAAAVIICRRRRQYRCSLNEQARSLRICAGRACVV